MSSRSTAPWQMSVLCMTSSQGAPGALPLFILRTQMMQKRRRRGLMEWNWMGAGFEWTSQSQKDPTHQHLGYIWAVLHMVEVAPVDLAVTLETMTVAMIAAMNEEAMIAMTTEITTDHTENVLHHRTTEGSTGHGPGHDPILRVAIE